ncbi:MAG: hypothetical protein ACRDT4_04620 [Micromonosporaceae bacterium]
MDQPVVRAVERWGLLAGVTGVVANVLLIALYAVAIPGNHAYGWTGPANDVIGGIVSTGAMIPMAYALRRLAGGGRAVWVATHVAVAGMALLMVLSLLLVLRLIPFSVQGAGAVPAIVAMFAWLGLVGRAGLATGGLPRGLARWAVGMALAVGAGMVLVGISLLLPWGSIPQYVLGGAGLFCAAPAFLAYPVWLIVLSSRIRGHQPPS